MLETRESLLSGVAVAVGFFLLASSSLFMDDWRKVLDDCHELEDQLPNPPDNLCRRELFYVLGASFGIIAACIQMLSAILSLVNKLKFWPWVQLLSLLLSVLAFTLPIAEKAGELTADDGNGSGRFFLSCTMINAVFLLLAAPIMFYWTK